MQAVERQGRIFVHCSLLFPVTLAPGLMRQALFVIVRTPQDSPTTCIWAMAVDVDQSGASAVTSQLNNPDRPKLTLRMWTIVAFELFSCQEWSKNTDYLETKTVWGTRTYVHSEAGIRKDLGVGIFARRVAVELHLAAVELDGVQGRPVQLVVAAQSRRLTPSDCRRFHQQIYITQRRLTEIWKGEAETYSNGCGVIRVLVQRYTGKNRSQVVISLWNVGI